MPAAWSDVPATVRALAVKGWMPEAEALASAGIGWAGALSDDDVQSVCEDRPEWPNGFRAALGRAFGAKEEAHG